MKGQESETLLNAELHVLYSSPSIRIMKTRRIRLAGHVA
jgi:hypothetical protein